MNSWFVYCITNVENGKKYVGKTMNKPRKRFKQHLCQLRNHKHNVEDMQEDYDKYGEKAFTLEVLEEINPPSFEELKKLKPFDDKDVFRTKAEREWQDKLNTRNRKLGYNYKELNLANGGKKILEE